ncbi:O-antigen ligase family protein [Mesonia mobilis]|uniref:O-antigen ligase family protein n=1 Tax=Mesonia mobilis TaxID=369791 RepID=UPI0024B96BA4|nr:O-antigen ligase family protein [Mesonia mobilis]
MKTFFKSLKDDFELILILAWLSIPFLAYNNIARLFFLVGLIVFFLKYKQKGKSNFLLQILFYVFYTFIINLFFSNGSFLFRHLQFYIFLICIYLSYVVFDFSQDKKQQIIFIILFFNFIAIVGSLLVLADQNDAARVLAKSSEEAIELSEKGAGGYGLVYLNVLIMPILFHLKIIVYINILCGLVFIFLANYLIAVILVLLQFLFYFLLKANFLKKILLLILMLLIFVVFLNFLNFFDEITYSLVSQNSLRYKQQDIFNILKGESAEFNTVGGRLERYLRSFLLFLENPLVGTLKFDDIGKHSNIIDQFAQYGLVVGIILLRIITKVPNVINNHIKNKRIIFVKIFLLTLILFGLCNNFASSLGVAFILLVCSINSQNTKLSTIE